MSSTTSEGSGLRYQRKQPLLGKGIVYEDEGFRSHDTGCLFIRCSIVVLPLAKMAHFWRVQARQADGICARLYSCGGLVPASWICFDSFETWMECEEYVQTLVTMPSTTALQGLMARSFSETSQSKHRHIIWKVGGFYNINCGRYLRDLAPTWLDKRHMDKDPALYGLPDLSERLLQTGRDKELEGEALKPLRGTVAVGAIRIYASRRETCRDPQSETRILVRPSPRAEPGLTISGNHAQSWTEPWEEY